MNSRGAIRRKWLIAAAATPVVLFLGAAVALRLLFPPERIRALVLEQAQKYLHREVKLGDAKLGLFGVDLTGLEIRERAGFPEGVFFSAETISVRPALLPLLRKKIVIRSALLKSPRLLIQRRKDGVLNIDDLASSTSTAAAPGVPAEPAGALDLVVQRIALDDGEFRWLDAAAGDDLRLKKAALQVNGLSFSAPFGLTASGEISGKRAGKPLAGRFSADARLNLGDKGVDIKSLEVVFGGSTLKAQGGLKNVAGAPAADLQVQWAPLDTASLAPFIDLPAEAAGFKITADIRVKGKADALEISGPISAQGPGLTAAGNLEAGVRTDPLAFEGSFKPTTLEIQRSALAPDVRLSGPFTGTLAAKGTPDKVAFSIDADLSAGAVGYGTAFDKPAGSPLKVVARGEKSGETLRISTAQVTSAAGAIHARGTLRSSQNQSVLDFTVSSPGLDLGGAAGLVPALRGIAPKGRAAFDARLTGTTAAPQAAGTAALSGVGATPVPGFSITETAGAAAFTMDSLSLKGLKGKIMGSPFALTASVKNLARPVVDVDAQFDKLDADALLQILDSTGPATAAKAPAPATTGAPLIAKLTGRIKVGEITHKYYQGKNFATQLALVNAGPDLSKLDGTFGFTAGEGRIKNLSVAKAINEAAHQEGEDITHDKLSTTGKIEKGLLTTNDFRLAGKLLNVSAAGTVRLTDTVAKMKAELRLPPGTVRGSAGDYLTDAQGWQIIPGLINGPLTDRGSFKPDTGALLKRAGQNAINKQLAPVLEKWGLGSGQDAKSSTAPVKSPEQQLKDLGKGLKNIFKR